MIQKDFSVLKMCSRSIKIAAWTFLLFGLIHAIGIISGVDQNIPRWIGIIVIMLYSFAFLIVYILALMADLMLEIWQFLRRERI